MIQTHILVVAYQLQFPRIVVPVLDAIGELSTHAQDVLAAFTSQGSSLDLMGSSLTGLADAAAVTKAYEDLTVCGLCTMISCGVRTVMTVSHQHQPIAAGRA